MAPTLPVGWRPEATGRGIRCKNPRRGPLFTQQKPRTSAVVSQQASPPLLLCALSGLAALAAIDLSAAERHAAQASRYR